MWSFFLLLFLPDRSGSFLAMVLIFWLVSLSNFGRMVTRWLLSYTTVSCGNGDIDGKTNKTKQ